MTWIEPKKRVYICGPISGLPNLNREEFEATEILLRKKGFEPINPHITCKNILLENFNSHEDHWNACMRADIAQLLTADFIYVLPRWDQSVGARIEVRLAKGINIPFLRCSDLDGHHSGCCCIRCSENKRKLYGFFEKIVDNIITIPDVPGEDRLRNF